MKYLKNAGIRTKIVLVIIALTILIFVGGSIVFINQLVIKSGATNLNKNIFFLNEAVIKLSTIIKKTNYLIENDIASGSFANKEQIDSDKKIIQTTFNKIKINITNPELLAKITKINNLFLSFYDAGIKTIEFGVMQEFDKFGTESKKFINHKKNLLKLLDDTQKYNSGIMKTTINKVENLSKTNTITMIIVFAVLFLFFVVLIYLIPKAIKPIIDINDVFAEVSNGDLRMALKVNSNDEIGKLSESINKTILNLKKIIIGVKSSAKSVSSASIQISSSTEELAATVEQQSEQARSVSASIQELVETSNEIAVSIDKTQDVADNSAKLTKDGSIKIQESIDSLKRIQGQTDNLKEVIENLGNSTNKIGNIIEVINDVSDQTNLLALNAAIEAARAGDAGRGFSVVADEVRKLAERTAKATKEIAEIIGILQKESSIAAAAMIDTSKEVENGTKLGNKSLEILLDIVSASEKILKSTASVATAVTQENSTIEEIGNNIEGIATATSESAGAVSEVAATAEDLAKQAETLILMVDKFKTE